jgi:hypothetical protein
MLKTEAQLAANIVALLRKPELIDDQENPLRQGQARR